MPKVIMSGIIVLLTIACVLGYMHKRQGNGIDNGPNTNWIWNNDWQSSGGGTPPPPGQPPIGGGPPVMPPSGNQLTASNYKEAVQIAGREGKPILVMFSATWCTWCQKMKAETLTDPQVSALMTNYVYVVVDVDKERDVANKFNVKSIPAYNVTNSKEENLKSGVNYLKPSEFAVWLNNPSMFSQPKSGPPIQPLPDEKQKPQNPPQRQKPQQRQQRPPQNTVPPQNCPPGGS